jgi:hypothetical protein
MPAWSRAIMLGATLLVACSGVPAASPGPAPSFEVRGAGVVVHSQAAFVLRPDLPGRLESTIDAALAYWGGDWRDMEGRTVTLEGDRYVQCHGVASATGCFDGDIRVSTSDLGNTFSCVEQTELVHEVGHAVIGDAAHQDPRWMDFEAVAGVLAGRVGYTGAGQVECPIFVSVWRHPPRR